MELEQLLRQLHEYTKVEEYLMNHREVRQQTAHSGICSHTQ